MKTKSLFLITVGLILSTYSFAVSRYIPGMGQYTKPPVQKAARI
ncbi:MAG: hypothetical protein K0R49_1106 [Burkholderiales bacterium]|jgi:hypothetical protein|nr:hypothetical protein [Burkholderiales bacterium]